MTKPAFVVVPGASRIQQTDPLRKPNAPLSPEQVFELQLKQRTHDDVYHPEISRLSVHHRLNHLALHFAKYAGRIAKAIETGDGSDLNRTVTDIFIIALSAANVLNLDLGRALEARRSSSRKAGVDASQEALPGFLVTISAASGRMAGACEAIDHLEPRPFRDEICSALIDLAFAAARYAEHTNVVLPDAISKRLEQVREKKLFHGHL